MHRWPLPLFALAAALLLSAPPATAALLAPADLQARVEAFAGRPAPVDPRLLLPDCPDPQLAWAPGGRSVAVSCAAPAWQVFVAVPGAGAAPVAPVTPVAVSPAAPVIRRGDHVMAEARGPGFVVGIESTAVADARDGRVSLRAANGRLLAGTLLPGGGVAISGLSSTPDVR